LLPVASRSATRTTRTTGAAPGPTAGSATRRRRWRIVEILDRVGIDHRGFFVGYAPEKIVFGLVV
jgi:hypothetical protein